MNWPNKKALIVLQYVGLGFFMALLLAAIICSCLPLAKNFLQTLDNLFR